MVMKHWSQEENCENHDLLIARAKELRSQMICETLIQLKTRVMSIFKT